MPPLSTFLPELQGRGCQLFLACKHLVGHALPFNAGQRAHETVAVISLAIVVPERLLVQVTEQMERFDRDVGSPQTTLQQRPDIFDPVRVNLADRIGFGTVDDVVNVLGIKARVGPHHRAYETGHGGSAG